MGTKYSPEEWKLNKQLCKAAGLGQEKEMRRLVKQGADPSYQVLRRIGERFRGGLVLKAQRPFYQSTLGSRAIKQKRRSAGSQRRRNDTNDFHDFYLKALIFSIVAR